MAGSVCGISIISVIVWTVLLIHLGDGHPQCLDSRPPFHAHGNLSFCKDYEQFGCCTPEHDRNLTERFHRIGNLIPSWGKSLWGKCSHFAKTFLCQTCSPFAAHIFDAERTADNVPIPRAFPALCGSYCTEFYKSCKDLVKYYMDEVGSTYMEENVRLNVKVNQNESAFCSNVSVSDMDYCYPELLSNPVLNGNISIEKVSKEGCICVEPYSQHKFRNPIFLKHVKDGSNRLFIGEQIGRVHIMYINGTILPEYFLDITGDVKTSSNKGDERGMLGMEFHPNYVNNGKFYIYYSTPLDPTEAGMGNHKIRIEELKVDDNNPNMMNYSYSRVILEVIQPWWNHNGGEVTTTQGSVDPSSQQRKASSTTDTDVRRCCIREGLQKQGLNSSSINIILSSWSTGTSKQYRLAWQSWYFWCLQRSINPLFPTEFVIIRYLDFLRLNKKSYSVLNTHKAMLLQTLPLLSPRNSWCSNCPVISRYMKGIFVSAPPKPRYAFTWDVSIVLRFLKTLYPLSSLSLKMLTFKVTALIALATAPRAQTLVALNLDFMTVHDNEIVFYFPKLLKTYRVGRANNFVLKLEHYSDEKLCPMHTLLFYIKFTERLRKSKQVLISYVTFLNISTSTIARWLKTVLSLAGIDISVFKSHSYRSAAVSAAFVKGCSLKNFLKTANWASDKNFFKFYNRSVVSGDVSFAKTVFNK